MDVAATTSSKGFLRHSAWDAIPVGLSLAHAALLLLVPSIPVVAIGLWWNANTVSHTFIHAPYFRSRGLNGLYSVYLSALLGIPQTLWRERHLRHHRSDHRELRWSGQLLVEIGVVLTLWAILVVLVPGFVVRVYTPGYLIGLGLCFLQGHFEHAGGTTSHYGRLYNVLFLNDGHHVEHHRRPGEHWTRLGRHTEPGARRSRWPPVLRWLDYVSLEGLERLVLHSTWLQRFVLAVHQRAFRTLLTRVPPVHRVTIVGGGLFPRTALILGKLLPAAALTVVDTNAEHIEIARTFLNGHVTYRRALYDPARPDDADLVVIPLAFIGDRDEVYRRSPAPLALVHDWMWKRHGEGVPVSWLLLKRLNLVTR